MNQHGDALRLGSNGEDGSFYLWTHVPVWVAGKTMWIPR